MVPFKFLFSLFANILFSKGSSCKSSTEPSGKILFFVRRGSFQTTKTAVDLLRQHWRWCEWACQWVNIVQVGVWVCNNKNTLFQVKLMKGWAWENECDWLIDWLIMCVRWFWWRPCGKGAFPSVSCFAWCDCVQTSAIPAKMAMTILHSSPSLPVNIFSSTIHRSSPSSGHSHPPHVIHPGRREATVDAWETRECIRSGIPPPHCLWAVDRCRVWWAWDWS